MRFYTYAGSKKMFHTLFCSNKLISFVTFTSQNFAFQNVKLTFYMKQRYAFILFLLLLLISGFYYVQQKKQTALFDKHLIDHIHAQKTNVFFEQADAYKYAQDYGRARVAFAELLPKSHNADDSLYTYNQLIYCDLAMNEDSATGKCISELERHFPDVDKRDPSVSGDYFYNKGVFCYRVFHPKEAEAYLQKALGYIDSIYEKEHLKKAQCLATLGVLHYEFTHTPDSAFLYLPKAYAIFQKNKDILRGVMPECLLGMSMISRSKRQYDEATGYCEEAVNILTKLPFVNKVLLARCLISKARSVNVRLSKASKIEDRQRINREIESYFQQAVAICPKNNARLQELHQVWARHYARFDTLGILHYQELFWQQVSSLENTIKVQGGQTLGFPNYLKGVFYDSRSKEDSALYYLLPFTMAYQKDSLHNRLILSDANVTLAYAYEFFSEQRKNPLLLDSALTCFKINLLNYADDKNLSKSWADIIQPAFYEKVSFQFAPLSVVVRLLLKKYQATGDRKSLDLTLKMGKLVDDLLFSGITSQDDDAYDNFQFEAAESTYNAAIKTAVIYYELTKSKHYLNDLFHFGERVRSFLLYRDADLRDSLVIVSPPQYVRDKIRRLESGINQLKWAIEQGQSDNITLMQKQNLREQLYAELKQKFPEYYRLKVVQPVPSIQQVQAQLDDNQCFVQYTFTDVALNVLFIRKQNTYFYETAWDTANQNKVYKLCSYMNGQNKESNLTAQSFGQLSYEVYGKLFPIKAQAYQQFIKGCEALIISPDRQLNILPFETLVQSKPDTRTYFNRLPYLVNQFAISYAPSWKIHETNHRIMIPSQATLRAYTYDFDSKELLSAKKEFTHLKRIFGSKASFIIGKNASADYFLKDTIELYDILHLSLHAQSDPLSKYNNTIYFAPHRQDSINGFSLLNRRFKEKLVVLSACQSASGKIIKGEGTYALSRIFLRTGVPHVVASLWSISDIATEKITTPFYEALVNQHFTPSQALNHAKRQYIKSSDELTGHPRFWAGLVCID